MVSAIFRGIAPHESLKGIVVDIIGQAGNLIRVQRADKQTIYGNLTEWFHIEQFFFALPKPAPEPMGEGI